MPGPDSPAARPDLATLCARNVPPEPSSTQPLVPPLQFSAVYRIPSLAAADELFEGRAPGYFYARDGHPNADELAARLAALEGAAAGVVCASGMAAESVAFLMACEAGSHVVMAEGIYGKTAKLVNHHLARFGVTATAFDPTDPATLRQAMRPGTRLVFAETVSNPLVRVADLEGLAEVAHHAGAALFVDNTFTPLLCRPIEHGAGLVTHSLTKLIGGHSDLTQGVLVGPSEAIARARQVATDFGFTGNPFECWLCLRGVATLAVRSERVCRNALELAGRLEAHPRVRAVHYPGLPGHPDHARARRLLQGGFGAMLTIDLGSREAVEAFLRGLRQIPFAPSLGDVATTISHPATTSHRSLSPEARAAQGITPGLVRISVGLEHPADLWSEFAGALDALAAQGGS